MTSCSKRLNLTGDRPLTRREALKLARWWAGWGSVTLTKQGRLWGVTASR